MQLDAIERRDLRHTCYHEFAHFHVARHFGVFGFVEIEHNADGGIYEKFWSGKCFMLRPPPTPHAAQMIGIAGAVAEWLLEWPLITHEQLWQEFYLDPDILGETDAALVGEVTPMKVQAALHLVRRLWPDIKADAELHIASEERGVEVTP
jgi:hypothetical protein